MTKLEIDFFERKTPWTLVVDEDRAKFFRHGRKTTEFSVPAADLLRYATPLPGDQLLKAQVGGKMRVFRVGEGPWESLHEFFLGYGDVLVSQQLKLRAKIAAVLAPWAIGEVVFSWQSFAVPVALLLGLQWVAAHFVRRASVLVAASTFLLLAAFTDSLIKWSWGWVWIQWLLPVAMVAIARGHWKTYRWLTRSTSQSGLELGGAVCVGLLAWAAVTAWGYFFGGWDVWVWLFAPEWVPKADLDFAR
ncbi:MAG: hypothetical protein ACRBN8_30420 [Nannocystales bacterium]